MHSGTLAATSLFRGTPNIFNKNIFKNNPAGFALKITKDIKLVSKFVKRREKELPYIQTRAINGIPVKAGAVSLILYSHDVLLENDENTTDADWELISINAIPEGEDTMPIAPVTMMRNQLNFVGGTKARYSTEEWAKSVLFWQKYASLNPVNLIHED